MQSPKNLDNDKFYLASIEQYILDAQHLYQIDIKSLNTLKKLYQNLIGLLKNFKGSLKLSVLYERGKVLLQEKYKIIKNELSSKSASQREELVNESNKKNLKDQIEEKISKNKLEKEKIELEKNLWKNKYKSFKKGLENSIGKKTAENNEKEESSFMNDYLVNDENNDQEQDIRSLSSNDNRMPNVILTPNVIKEIDSLCFE